jgi:hypothetical protein
MFSEGVNDAGVAPIPPAPPLAWPVASRPTADRHSIERVLLTRGGFYDMREGRENAALAAVRAHLDSLIADGLPVGPDGKFDPVNVTNATVAAGMAGRSDFWRSEISTGRRLISNLVGQGSGVPDLRGLPPRRFDLVFRRTFTFNDVEPKGSHRLRMPLPIEDQYLTDLVIHPEDGPSEGALISPGRLELRTHTEPSHQVALGARLSFTAWPQGPAGPLALSQLEREKWLRDREGTLLLTDKVMALARHLTRIEGAAETVEAFRDHIFANFRCGVVPYGEFEEHPLDWMLDTGWFDCRLGALLIVALCRATGVPARLVGGYLIWDVPAEHYWMEAWLPNQGWTPIDLLAWDLSEGGKDDEWRTVYDGVLDYRMKTQVFPDIFTGSPGIPFPTAWRRLAWAVTAGSETRIISAVDGEEIYRDEILFCRQTERTLSN